MAFSFKPSGAASINVAYGVDAEISGYIIQTAEETEATENLTIPDQKGRTAQVIAYQKAFNLTLTMIGPDTAPTSAGSELSYDGDTWIVNSVTRNCTYNDTAKWQIQAVRYLNATYSDKTDDSI